MRTNSSSVATKYQHSQVSHADPVQLIVLLYDGALSRIAQGRQRLQEKDLPHAGVAISKAQAIVGELRQSLNMEAGGEVAKNLNSLYAYVHDPTSIAVYTDGNAPDIKPEFVLLTWSEARDGYVTVLEARASHPWWQCRRWGESRP